MLELPFANVIWSAAAFIIALGALVAFHEFGHFWVARRCGVKVLRYSIGFGKPLWSRVSPRSGVEYVIAAIPLGGYVKMLDEREGDVDPALADQAFNRQSVYKRIAIVVAGPAANFLLALVVYWCVFLIGSPGVKPELGTVPADTVAAEAGLQQGMVVTALNGNAVESWDGLRPRLIEAALDRGTHVLTVTDETGGSRDVTLDFSDVSVDPQALFAELGMNPPSVDLPPVLGEVVSGAPAATAGLQPGDRIVSLAGEPVETWTELRGAIRARPGASVDVVALRDGQRIERVVRLESVTEGEQSFGRIGAGVEVPEGLYDGLRVMVRYGPIAAIGEAASQTWRMSALTLRMIGRMITGDVSVKNVSGPIHIAEYAGYSAQAGLTQFLSFIAIVSVSLGVLNLLPVPVLDGGHLLYYLAELVKGSPLSDKVQAAGQQIGLLLLFMLMSLAFYNDISRLIG